MKIQLFNGKDLDDWAPRGGHSQHQWDVVGHIDLDAQNPKQFTTKKGEGIFYNGPTGRTVDLYTKYQHGDCELHIEFVVPQGSNSGIYFMTKYEIQILDSWGETDLTFGTCGGVYARWINEQSIGGTPPRINMSKPPGEWQTYDIVFKAPRFNQAGDKTDNAKFVKVIWNGEIWGNCTRECRNRRPHTCRYTRRRNNQSTINDTGRSWTCSLPKCHVATI